jgi:Tol biopolymer transport system component/tRNA A-37 threonylcarbamoyl transferase component Bud32
MTRELWRQIDVLFDEALELPAPERKNFIDRRCAGNKRLKNELLSLLQARENSREFIEDAAIKLVAKRLAGENSAFPESLAGKTLNCYRIEKLIGRGGMGEVYLGFDEKLKRRVALKILPRAFRPQAADAARLRREARAVSALNHPNIVTVFDVGSFDSIEYIATEYVEGRTLREILCGAVSLEKGLEMIIQCCEALSAAHRAGIVHRDIKPENIMLRPDGYVKILDFGLATLNENDENAAPDPFRPDGGAVFGTPAYMSPEQALGAAADHRTDLWSVGVVLAEILTGENPFKRESRHETIQAIIHHRPDLRLLPRNLKTVLLKALEKDAARRYRTAAELKADLLTVKRALAASDERSGLKFFQPLSGSFARGFSLFAAAALIAVLAVVFFGSVFFRGPQPAEKPDWTKARSVQLTGQTGTEGFPHLAPDGETFVFAARTNGRFDIFLQKIGEKTAVNLTEDSPADDTQPVFSPDGRSIAFRSERAGGGIFVMDTGGRNLRRIADFGFYPAWSPDGRQIAVDERGFFRPSTRPPGSLWIINVETGEKRKLTGDRAYQPSWSPDGRRIAFWFIHANTSRRDVATVSVDGGEPVPVTDAAGTNWNPVFSPDGKYLYFASDRSGNMAFWRVPLDAASGKPLGEAEIVPTPAKFNSHASFSADGKRLIYVQSNIQSNLKTLAFDPEKGKPSGPVLSVTSGDYEIRRPRLSPDGRHFVFDLARQTQEDIVALDRDGKNWRDLTDDPFFDRYPVWSPDGRRIAFISDRAGNHDIWLMNKDGTDLRQLISKPHSVTIPVWAPGGRRLIYRQNRTEHIILDFKEAGGFTETKLPEVEGFFYQDWDWSPHGKKIAGRWNEENGRNGIGYFSLEDGKYVKLRTGESTMPQWLPDGRRLIFAYQEKLFVMDTIEPRPVEIFSLPNETIFGSGISRDGRLIYFTAGFMESNIWLLDLRPENR